MSLLAPVNAIYIDVLTTFMFKLHFTKINLPTQLFTDVTHFFNIGKPYIFPSKLAYILVLSLLFQGYHVHIETKKNFF